MSKVLALLMVLSSCAFANERTEISLEPNVRVVIDAPSPIDPTKPVRLILYAAPAGNTIEQTFGRKVQPGDDWHFDIQHIAAQTRWLREHVSDANLVVACLQCTEKSWPAWRRKHDLENRRIPPIVDALRQRFASHDVRLVLSGHSAGGSFIFGYLDALAEVPADVERIAFLDSNYAYDSTKDHAGKLRRWLDGGAPRSLCVLAYHDSIALLDGKPFVSEDGGTWGRSHAMQRDLSTKWTFTHATDADFQCYTALDGRVKFLLKENPQRKILHTRQVELNGFIHALLTGTALEEKDYRYFGPRAYEAWIVTE